MDVFSLGTALATLFLRTSPLYTVQILINIHSGNYDFIDPACAAAAPMPALFLEGMFAMKWLSPPVDTGTNQVIAAQRAKLGHDRLKQDNPNSHCPKRRPMNNICIHT